MDTCSQCSSPREPGRKLCRAHLDYYKRAATKWREKKRAEGLCVVCGKNPLVTKSLCEECRKRTSNTARKARIVVCTLCAVSGHHRRQHKQLGLCWHCNKKAKNGLCAYHLEDSKERHRERIRQRRQILSQKGSCGRCGKPSQGKTLCPKHLAYMQRWQKNYRSRTT
jgi:hypothetical protein